MGDSSNQMRTIVRGRTRSQGFENSANNQKSRTDVIRAVAKHFRVLSGYGFSSRVHLVNAMLQCTRRLGFSFERAEHRGASVAQSVKRPTSAQVVISRLVSSSPASGSVSPSRSASPLLVLSLSLKNKHYKNKKQDKIKS